MAAFPFICLQADTGGRRARRDAGPAVIALLLVAASLSGCGEKRSAEAAKTPPAPSVTVSRPEQRQVTSYDEYVGRFVAVDAVDVRAQVSGYLQGVNFADGALVKKGDLLFEIDPRPFQAALDQSKGALEQAKANLAFAEADLKRGQELPRGTVITQQTLDQRIQARAVALASVVAQTAAERQAELSLQFTRLMAPISGRIGDRRVSAGNLVIGGSNGSTTLLATITTVDPIRFEFTVDEASYLRYLGESPGRAAADSVNRGLNAPVLLKLIGESDFGHVGHVDFVDNAIDPATGTIRVRAEFPNGDSKLTPGMFGRIEVAAAPPAAALLVPDTAIASEQAKKIVYVVGSDDVVSARPIVTGRLVDGLRVVESGLSPDDLVVTEGLMRVRPGGKVNPKQASATKETTVRAN